MSAKKRKRKNWTNQPKKNNQGRAKSAVLFYRGNERYDYAETRGLDGFGLNRRTGVAGGLDGGYGFLTGVE